MNSAAGWLPARTMPTKPSCTVQEATLLANATQKAHCMLVAFMLEFHEARKDDRVGRHVGSLPSGAGEVRRDPAINVCNTSCLINASHLLPPDSRCTQQGSQGGGGR